MPVSRPKFWAQSLLAIGAIVIASLPGLARAAASPTDAAARVDKLLIDDIANAAAQADKKPDDSKSSGAAKSLDAAKSSGENQSADSKADAKSDSKSWKSAVGSVDSAASDSYTSTLPAVTTAKQANDETYLRRVTMDLIGKPPTPAQITAFALDPSPDKRANAVDRLLARPEFGENWGRYWRDVMFYRRIDDRALIGSTVTAEYLTTEFNKNVPWDEIARSFITATGDVRENGATGLIESQSGQTPDVTAEVARIFMAIQIQCAQCHDHPFDRWKRTQFHELAAFFPRIGMRRVRSPDPKYKSLEVVSVDRMPKLKRKAGPAFGSAEHYMPDLKNPSSEGTLMKPVFFLTGQKLPLGTPDAERRETIAKWITSPRDQWFAKAFVNRIWSEMVGEGFYEPVDDIGPDRHCSAPETLDFLAKQFVAHDYDVKWLYRTIAATTAYQLDSRSRHLPGQTPFQANCPQMLRADELFDSLVSALGISNQPISRPGVAKKGNYGRPVTVRTLFDSVFGYDPSQRRDEISGSIPQSLILMNSPQLARAMNADAPTALGKLLDSTKDNSAVTEELYLRCLSREPKADELKTCLNYVKQTGSRNEAFEDIQWALVNSTEFLHRK